MLHYPAPSLHLASIYSTLSPLHHPSKPASPCTIPPQQSHKGSAYPFPAIPSLPATLHPQLFPRKPFLLFVIPLRDPTPRPIPQVSLYLFASSPFLKGALNPDPSPWLASSLSPLCYPSKANNILTHHLSPIPQGQLLPFPLFTMPLSHASPLSLPTQPSPKASL